ncbi:MAG TPA: hypothetical protein VKB49_16470 [Candidatus Sulfotelmatobacter sp.]|nr:hypothetical protein [Candidatus Sulfotelmatobacter sp.]
MFAVTAEDTCVTLADSEVSTTLSGDSIIRAKLERAEHMKSEFPPKPESDRVVDAGTRKLVCTTMVASLAMLFLLLLHRLHPSSVIRWVLGLVSAPYAYCLFAVINKATKIKSTLPPKMESKRIRIGKRHNSLAMILMLSVFALMIATMLAGAALFPGHQPAIIVIALTGSLLLEGFGLYGISEHDNAMCHQLGYLCPNCHKPLYEARAATYLNGLCPKCKKSIFSDSPQELVAST